MFIVTHFLKCPHKTSRFHFRQPSAPGLPSHRAPAPLSPGTGRPGRSPQHSQPQHCDRSPHSWPPSPSPRPAAPCAANLDPCWAPINSVFSIPVLAQRHCVSCAHRNSTLVTGPSCLHIPHMLPLLRTHVSVAPTSQPGALRAGQLIHLGARSLRLFLRLQLWLSEPQPETPRCQW